MEYHIVIRSFGMGLFSVEKAPPEGQPINYDDVSCAIQQIGSELVSWIQDVENPERAFVACSEGHIPCEQEMMQLNECIAVLRESAKRNPRFWEIFLRRSHAAGYESQSTKDKSL